MSEETKRLKDLLQVTDIGLGWMNRALDAEAKLAALTERIDAAIRAEIEKGGPLLIWAGDGGFPRDECRFRGLSVGEGGNSLTKWLGFGEYGGESK